MLTSAHFRKEFIGGLTTFLTVSYIIVVNPSILATQGTGMSFTGVMTATVTLCCLLTFFMGAYAKLPYAVAPGLGINAFFTYSLVLGQGVPWQQALGAVFWSGVLFIIASATPVRLWIVKAIPKELRLASAVGLGLFLSFIGFKNSGFIVANPATFVQLGKLTPEVLLAITACGLMFYLNHKRNPFAFLIGIAFSTLGAFAIGKAELPDVWVSMPDYDSVFLKVDVWGALQLALLPAIISMFFTDLFDSLSTFVGIAEATGLVDEKGHPLNVRQGLIVDAFATWGAAILGTSAGTAYLESAAGIEAGGRTGLSAMITALLFIPCLFLGPLAGSIPMFATAPVLVVIGFLMFKHVHAITFSRFEEAVPAFLTLVLIPLTFSITQGILWGFTSHVLLYTVVGRRKDVHPVMWPIALIACGLLWMENHA